VLRQGGGCCGRRRVVRLMRQAGLEGRHRRRRHRTTTPDPPASARPHPGRSRLSARPCRARQPLVRRHHLQCHRRGLALPGHGHPHRLPPCGRPGTC
jgi:hypothetical protein